MPASASASSRSLPAGPTNGAPARSSWSPGCSPTNMTSDFGEPSPKTVCVPVFQSGQALQPAAASVSFLSEGRVGTSGAAVSSSRLCWVIATFGYPGGVDTMRPSGAVAEWLGRGLQSLVHQFDSGRRLSRVPDRRRLPAGGAGLRRRLAPLTALLPAGRVPRHCPACIRTVSDASGTREDDSRVPERWRLPAGGAGLRRRLAPLTALLPAGRVARHCPACIRPVSDASGTREDASRGLMVGLQAFLPRFGAGLAFWGLQEVLERDMDERQAGLGQQLVRVPELAAHEDSAASFVLDPRSHRERPVDRDRPPVAEEHASGDGREAVTGRDEPARLVDQRGDHAAVCEPRPALVALVEGEGRFVAVCSLDLGVWEAKSDRVVATPKTGRVVVWRDLHRSALSASPSRRIEVV